MSQTAIRITLPPDRGVGGGQDLTNTLKTIETVLNRHEQAIKALQPAVRVVTSNGYWLSTDRVVLIDTTAGNVTYTIPSPIDALQGGYERLVVKWIQGAGNAVVATMDGSLIDLGGSVTITPVLAAIELVPSVEPGAWGWWII